MQIIWDQSVIQKLKNSHTLLELETFEVKGSPVTTYCVVPADKIGLNNISTLDRYTELHSAFVKAYYDKNYQLCRDIAEHLMGQFGGECDTFYKEILNRIKDL